MQIIFIHLGEKLRKGGHYGKTKTILAKVFISSTTKQILYKWRPCSRACAPHSGEL